MPYDKAALDRYTQNYLATFNNLAKPTVPAPPALNPLQRQTFPVPSLDTGGYVTPPPAQVDQGGPSVFSKISDILARPLYAVANAYDQSIDMINGVKGANPLEGLKEGITGESKKTFGDVFAEDDVSRGPEILHRILGTGADLVLDPLNLIPASWITAPLKMGAKGVAMTTKVGRAAHESEKALREAEKVAAKEREAQAAVADEPITEKVSSTGEVPEQTAQDIVSQVVEGKKAAAGPKVATAPSPADIKPTEEIPLPPEPAVDPSEVDYFPDFSGKTPKTPTAPPTAAPKPWENDATYQTIKKRYDKAVADPNVDPITLNTIKQNLAGVMKRYGAKDEDLPNFTGEAYKANQTTAEAMAPDPSAPKDIGDMLGGATGGFTPEATMQASMNLVEKHQAKLDELMKIPNPTKEQLKEIKKVQINLESAQSLVEKGRKAGIVPTSEAAAATPTPEPPKPSIIDEVTAQKIPEAEAKPPISEETATTHADAILKGELIDVDNIKQSEEMNKAIKNARLSATGKDFAARQGMATDKAVSDFAKQAEASRAIGNEPFIAAPSGHRFPISMDQAIETLAKNGHADSVSKGLFNTAHEIGPHAFNAGLAEALRIVDTAPGLLRDEVVDSIVNAMSNATTPTYHKLHLEHTKPYVKNQWASNHKIAQRNLAEAMVDSIDDLVDVVSSNKARYSKRVTEESQVLTNVTNERVAEAMKPNTSASEAAELINDIPKAEKKAAEEIKATPEARVNASVGSVGTITDVGIDVKSTEAAAKKAKSTATGNQDAVEATAKAETKRAVEDFDKIGTKAHDGYVYDLDARNAVQLEGIIERTTNWFGTKFLPNYGAAQLADFWRINKSFNSSTAARFGKILNSLAKEYKPSDIKDAWQILRDTTKTKAPTGLTEEMDGLVKKLNVAAGAIYDFRGMKDSAFYTSFMQIGLDLRRPEGWDLINRALSRRGIGHNFKTVKNDKNLSRTEIASQYLDWDVENPLEFLHNSFEALRDLATNKAIADHVINKWGVTSARAGYVKLIASKHESEIFDFLPKKTTYYVPKEAAQQLTNLEKIMSASTNFKGQKGVFARFITDTVDPIMQMWKTLVTIVRPSHHMRNLVGDMSASWIDGVYGQAPYRKAMGMLVSQRQKKSFEDQVLQIQGLISPVELKQVMNPKFTVSLSNGREEKLDSVMMNRLAYQSGILPLFTSVEDILSESSRGLGRVSKGMMESKPIKFMGNISEKTSHLGRLSHYVALMERSSFTRKFPSLEAASHAASKRIRQFHPDSSGLTAFEQKYMRRLFPFYSWFRQAAPTFAARLAVKPARINDLNKVQYEFASAMGVNPQSLSDPFPEDQEFPSWLRSSAVGPWTKGGLTMNFGTPIETITNLANQTPETTQSGNPQIAEQLLNMLNPAIKAPIELTSGSMVTNRPVSDTSEYVDSLIPGMSTVGRAFGSWSPSGTLMNAVTGQNTGGPGPVDPIQSRIRDGENTWLNRGLLNFMLGIGSGDAYSPTNQKIANAERLTRVNGGG